MLPAFAQQWKPLGPEGGDVRSLAFDPTDPDRMFLGTSAGQLYISTDGGHTWARYAHLGNAADMVLDNIVIDFENPRIMYVAAWSVEAGGGDLFISHDGGRNWETNPALHNKSIRALAMAPSDHQLLVAAALDGVYRTRDAGDGWERISPENHAEIKDIQSVAIDPVNPEIIYAGTWHLPWKTEDGGRHWHNIKKGVIDDSDVFSIIIDPANPATVYASACSGIYKSQSAGELFQKIQGMPFSARRTRVLRMDPANHNVVYAGTTEGLWKSADAGATWKRMTAAKLIVNGVLIDPRNSSRVLLATDRGGVLASDDGGASFAASNRGFTHREVSSVLVDRNNSSEIYVGLLNDKEFGGVFVTQDDGESWKQLSHGLEGRDVFVLRQAEDGSLLAGTNAGLFMLPAGASEWQPFTGAQKGAVGNPLGRLRVMSLELTHQRWFAATSLGLFISVDHGRTWLPEKGASDLISVSAANDMVVAAGHHSVMVSVNGGESWLAPHLSQAVGSIHAVTVDDGGTIWLAAREGVFRSTNAGDSWEYMRSLPLSNVVALRYQAESHRLLAAGSASTGIYESADNGRTWRRTDAGWLLRDLHPANGRIFAATAFDGLIAEPTQGRLAANEREKTRIKEGSL